MVSSRIQKRLGLVNGFAEVAVPDRRIHHEINRPAEHRLQPLPDAEICVRIAPVRKRFELNQEVEVGMRWVVMANRGRAEQLQALDAVSTTQIGEGGGVLGEHWAHGGYPADTIAQKGRPRNLTTGQGFSEPEFGHENRHGE